MGNELRQIRAWMALHRLTQNTVAAEADVSQQFVSLYLAGKRTSGKLTAYYAAKGCPERYLPQLTQTGKQQERREERNGSKNA